MSKPVLLCSAIGATLLSGCGPFYERPEGLTPERYNISQEEELLDEVGRARGLALSGGGIRAAYYSLGAMKALYDAGWLQDVDLLSTVSGGGYTAYWMLTSELARPSTGGDFGGVLLSDQNFPATICNVMAYANFVPIGRGLLRLPRGFVRTYHNAIGRSFGFYDPKASVTMRDFQERTAQDDIPYWIANFTNRNALSGRESVFEVTPWWMGHRESAPGYWGDWSITARQVATVSGAAFSPLTQKITDPAGDGDQLVRVWDGGKSENLGFYSLSKRAPEQIVVIDAEHDFKRQVGALTKALGYIVEDGGEAELQAPPAAKSPDRFFAKATSSGWITNAQGRPSAVYYLKMSVPESFGTAMNEDRLSRGLAENDGYMERLDATKVRGNWQCAEMAGDPVDMDAWLTWTAAAYGRYMNDESYTRYFRNRVPTILASDFPQNSTVDTSYYIDQARAFVAIGYLGGLELIEEMGE